MHLRASRRRPSSLRVRLRLQEPCRRWHSRRLRRPRSGAPRAWRRAPACARRWPCALLRTAASRCAAAQGVPATATCVGGAGAAAAAASRQRALVQPLILMRALCATRARLAGGALRAAPGGGPGRAQQPAGARGADRRCGPPRRRRGVPLRAGEPHARRTACAAAASPRVPADAPARRRRAPGARLRSACWLPRPPRRCPPRTRTLRCSWLAPPATSAATSPRSSSRAATRRAAARHAAAPRGRAPRRRSRRRGSAARARRRAPG
jgi:hypothetical protein